MSAKNPAIDNYLAEGCGRCPLGGTPDCKVHSWTEELKELRRIVLECGLTEELKWGVPCYTYGGKNVAMVSAFKNYSSLSFFKGSLLSNSHGILQKPGKSSQASRVIRFKRVDDIIQQQDILKAHILEAVEVEKAGLEVQFKSNPEPIPDELQEKLDNDPAFCAAFESLTPGRQRGYILHFSNAKQSSTRISRIEKCTPMIMSGIGLHDKYKSGK